MSKKKLRKKFLIHRKSNFKLSSVKLSSLNKILKKFNLIKNKKIGAYYPVNYEIECFEIIRKLKIAGHKISLPVVKEKNEMDFYEWSLEEPLNVNKMGIPEPNQKKKIYPDILLVPLVAFDKCNYRLGYGGGYYDRYIKKIFNIKKILTIGLAFSFQKMDRIPINDNDEKLDFILTEKSFNI